MCKINKLDYNFKGIQTNNYWESICDILNKFVKERADLKK